MSLDILKKIMVLDNNYYLHNVRILILISILCNDKIEKELKGITKLAKLDFFLRYPTALKRALQKLGKTEYDLNLHDHELDSVESKMIRFRYGPWDMRYRQYLAILESMRLIGVSVNKQTIEIRITSKGIDAAKKFKQKLEFQDFVSRAQILNATLGKMKGTELKDMVYVLIPELHDMKFGELIKP